LDRGFKSLQTQREVGVAQGFIASGLRGLTKGWGSEDEITLYLAKCQVDTPKAVVDDVWKQILVRRRVIGKVVDYGAGDGRFSQSGRFASYVGYEIDNSRWTRSILTSNVCLVNKCAFSEPIWDADLSIGNPPYVRNQDLPDGWRQRATRILSERTGIQLSGLANAWQYFFLLSLISTKPNGLVALVIPYEWVSRPSAAAIREYIKKRCWEVSVYRLLDDTFPRVLTTSSITVVDKSQTNRRWQYFEEVSAGRYMKLPSVTPGEPGVLPYTSRTRMKITKSFAKRGLSPGTQKVLTFSEQERARLGLRIGRDVVPCITSLRHLDSEVHTLDKHTFQQYYCKSGKKCWLINTTREPSDRLGDYLKEVPADKYQTKTCQSRDRWWQFVMPQAPDLLLSSGFIGNNTKVVVNSLAAHAVGGVCGIYKVPRPKRSKLAKALRKAKLGDRVVAHANGLRKIEIHQMNSLLAGLA